jgi:O-succinylbenzoic acid--CoA ligase
MKLKTISGNSILRQQETNKFQMSVPEHIRLNGQKLSAKEIPPLLANIRENVSVPDWQKELFRFLNEWFSDSDVVVAQTSGSTGEPKPLELPKSLMRKSAERTIAYFGLKKDDRLLLSLSCRYIAGKMMVVRAVVGQMNLITTDPAGNFDVLNDQHFDFGAMVPNQVFKLLEQPFGKERLENIQNLLVGGSPISTDLETQISSLSSRVVLTYGMTETASHIAIRELSGAKRSDIYRCLAGISVDSNPDGCLQIHHPEFSEPLQTNDLAEVLSPATFRILGRADSVIISGGIKLVPESLEKKLEGIVRQRFVVSSVPDRKLGEKLILVIEGRTFDTKQLQTKIKSLFSSYERPRSVVFLKKFPETPSGKIIRDEIKKGIKST